MNESESARRIDLRIFSKATIFSPTAAGSGIILPSDCSCWRSQCHCHCQWLWSCSEADKPASHRSESKKLRREEWQLPYLQTVGGVAGTASCFESARKKMVSPPDFFPLGLQHPWKKREVKTSKPQLAVLKCHSLLFANALSTTKLTETELKMRWHSFLLVSIKDRS